LQFLFARGEHEPFLGGIKIGLIGNSIVWVAELVITFLLAWGAVGKAVDVSNAVAVPSEVSNFVSYLISKKYDRRQIEQELANKGWVRPEDQEKAIFAANSMGNLAADVKEDTSWS